MWHIDGFGHAHKKSPRISLDASSARGTLDADTTDCRPGSGTTPGQVQDEPVDDLSEFYHPVLYKVCRFLGMSCEAIRDWLQVHDCPITMAWFFIAALLGLLCAFITYTHLHQAVTWKLIVPLAISLSSESLNLLFFWRNGPYHAHTRICGVLVMLWSVPLSGVTLAAFFTPEAGSPLKSKPAFCGLASALAFCAAVTCKAGRIPTMRIPKLSSVQGLFMDSLCISIRMMDVLTSIFIVSCIVDEAKGGCTWFGTDGKCGQLVQVAVIIALFTALDVACCITLAVLRRMQAPYGSPIAYPRLVMLGHVVRILSEFVVLLAALVKLFSDTRMDALPVSHAPPGEFPQYPPPPPPPPADTSAAHSGAPVAMMLVSLAFSIASVVASILATGSIVQLLGDTVSVVSSGTSIWSRVRRTRRGSDAPTSLVVRWGFPPAGGGGNRVAPEPTEDGGGVEDGYG